MCKIKCFDIYQDTKGFTLHTRISNSFKFDLKDVFNWEGCKLLLIFTIFWKLLLKNSKNPVVKYCISGKGNWLSNIQNENTGRWNYSSLANRLDSIYFLGFYVLISFPLLTIHMYYLHIIYKIMLVAYFISNWSFFNDLKCLIIV